MLLHYLRKCSSSELASFHSNAVSLLCQFKAVAARFFKLLDSRLILILLYDSINLIISGVHQSHLSSWGHRSEKLKLRGLNCVAYKMCQYTVLLKDKIGYLICNVFGSY